MIIVEDLIPPSLQNLIEYTLLGNGFPWFLQNDITSMNGEDKALGFSHTYKSLDGSGHISPMFDLVSLIAHNGAKEANFNFKGVSQARSFLQIPLSTNILKNDVDALHVDSMMPHLVVLYYVCDSDGDTIIVNKKQDYREPLEFGCRYTDYEILQKVTPKKGRAVIFDGAFYHTAEQPKHNKRCIINFNIT